MIFPPHKPNLDPNRNKIVNKNRIKLSLGTNLKKGTIYFSLTLNYSFKLLKVPLYGYKDNNRTREMF